jgi:X-Pro dipeptidyl-peptidase
MRKIALVVIVLCSICMNTSHAQDNSPQPVFRKGQAQIVRAFSDKKTWIEEELWVETDFDSDRDGKPDRMHVYVTRPAQTESGNLKLPVVYSSSPYYGLKLLRFESRVGRRPEKAQK